MVPLGQPEGLERLSVAKNDHGHLEVFSTSNTGDLWHNYYQGDNQGGWSGWSSLGNGGQSLQYLTLGHNDHGHIEVFCTDDHGQAWHNYYQGDNQGGWSGWSTLGQPEGLERLSVAKNDHGHLEVFSTSNTGDLWHNYYPGDNQGGWSGWSSLGNGGQSLQYLTLGHNDHGHIEVFCTDDHGQAWHNYYQGDNQGGWSGWFTLGQPQDRNFNDVDLAEVAVITNPSGHLELFAAGGDQSIWHIFYQGDNQGGWSGWGLLGYPGRVLSLGDNDHNLTEAFSTQFRPGLARVDDDPPRVGLIPNI